MEEGLLTKRKRDYDSIKEEEEELRAFYKEKGVKKFFLESGKIAEKKHKIEREFQSKIQLIRKNYGIKLYDAYFRVLAMPPSDDTLQQIDVVSQRIIEFEEIFKRKNFDFFK